MVVQWIKENKLKFGLIVGGVIVAVGIIITFSILAANGAFNTEQGTVGGIAYDTGNDITTDSDTDSDTTDTTDSDTDSDTTDTTDSDTDSDTTDTTDSDIDSDSDYDTTDTTDSFTISGITVRSVTIDPIVFTKSEYTISEKPVWVASTSDYGDIYISWKATDNPWWGLDADVTWSEEGSISAFSTYLAIYENDTTKTDLDIPSTDTYFTTFIGTWAVDSAVVEYN